MAAVAANLKVILSGDSRGAEQAIARTQKGLSGLVGGVGKFAAGFLLANVIGKVAQGVGDLAGAALDFESNMANVDSIAQLTGRQLGELKQQVLSIAADPRIAQGPAELAAGLYDVESAGFASDAALTVLSTAAMAATAGLTDAATSGRAITAVLNAYGEGADQAGHVSDVLFQTVQDGVLTFDQLANNLGNTLPVAASLGISIEELGAAYAQMTLRGVNASQAETQIAALMRAALNPTKSLAQAVEDHGFASAQALIETKGLAGFLEVLGDAAGGSQEAMFDLLGTQEAMNAATILGSKSVKGYRGELAKMNKASRDGGATAKALERQMDSTSYAIGQLKKNVQIGAVVAFDLLGAPIRATIGILGDFVGGLTNVLLYVDDVVHGADRLGAALDLVPDPLRRTARGLALVVDGIADTVRAFREGGLQGAIDELGRIQGDRILSGLQTLGEEAWGAFKTGFTSLAEGAIDLGVLVVKGALALGGELPDAAGNLWGWVQGKLRGTSELGSLAGPWNAPPLSIGDVVVEGTLALGGEIADVAGDLWGWVYGQIVGQDTAAIPAGAGSRAGFQGGFAQTDKEVVPFGDIAVEAGLALTGAAAEWAGDIWGWVKDQLGVTGAATGGVGGAFAAAGLTNAEPIGIGDALIDVGLMLVDDASDLAGKAKDAIEGWFDGHPGGTVTLNNWSLNVDTPTDVAFGFALSDLVHLKINEKKVSAELDEWSLILGPPKVQGEDGSDGPTWIEKAIKDQGFQRGFRRNIGPIPGTIELGKLVVDNIGPINDALQEAMRTAQAGRRLILKDWGFDLGPPDIQTIGPELGALLGQWIGQKVRDADLPDVHLPSWNLSLPLPDISFGGAVGAFAAAFGGGFDVTRAIMEKIVGIVPDVRLPSWHLSLPDPDVPGIDFNAVFNWIWTKLASIGDVNVPFDNWKLEIGAPSSVTTAADLGKNLIQIVRDNLVPLSIGGGGTGTEADPLKFAANVTVNVADAQEAVSGLKTDLEGIDDTPYVAILDADRSRFDAVLSDADTSGAGFENNPYVGIIDGDRSLWDAVLWGAIQGGIGFDATTFTATIAVNDYASGPIQNVLNLIDSIPTQKTTTITTNLVTTGTPPPGRQAGGTVREPVTLVGERGPELVRLPYGSRVHTAGQTRGMMGKGGGNVYVTVNLKGDTYGIDHLERRVTYAAAKAISEADVEAQRIHAAGQGYR